MLSDILPLVLILAFGTQFIHLRIGLALVDSKTRMEFRLTPTLTAPCLHLLHLLPQLRTCPITEYLVCVLLFTFSLLPHYICCTASSTATFNTDQMVYLQRDLYRACDLDEAVEDDHWVSLGPLFTSTHLRRTLEIPNYKGTSIFTENEAYERRLTDREIVQSLLDTAESGHYLNNPRSHPAFDLSERGAAPACLHPFMSESSENIAFHRTGHLRGTPSFENGAISALLVTVTSPLTVISAISGTVGFAKIRRTLRQFLILALFLLKSSRFQYSPLLQVQHLYHALLPPMLLV
ncbi:hypothetical protein C8J55DRAFT_521810 [Lentinula edodes]|uniref:Uncharacterized protein n=1 Tax=Lentinula lateritia TaxID=40482 RepID=A0A9W9DIR3_9AGAR|nr:hypothetical protein C8J55DRAFT_521810 [Lentinula edodes]